MNKFEQRNIQMQQEEMNNSRLGQQVLRVISLHHEHDKIMVRLDPFYSGRNLQISFLMQLLASTLQQNGA
jgi:hypothetical protein